MNSAELVPLEVYEREATRRPPALKLLSYAEMAAMPEPEWLIDGLIQRQTAALMFGKSNSFKSFLAIDIGLSVASGGDWHGQSGDGKAGGVLFVATEGANGVGRLRIPAWYDHHHIPEDQRTAYLYPKEIRLDVADDVSALIAAMRADTFRLVVLDIFGGTMAGSEIEDKTARTWVHGIQRILRETGTSILTVAHTGWQDDTRARMHTHFWGSFDTRLRVEGDKDALTCSLTVERHKDADSNGQWGFRLEKTGRSLVPQLDADVKAASKANHISGKGRAALNALDDAVVASGILKTGQDWPPCKVVLIDQWREHFYRHSGEGTPEAKKKAFQRVRDQLHGKGMVAFYDDHVWPCRG